MKLLDKRIIHTYCFFSLGGEENDTILNFSILLMLSITERRQAYQ